MAIHIEMRRIKMSFLPDGVSFREKLHFFYFGVAGKRKSRLEENEPALWHCASQIEDKKRGRPQHQKSFAAHFL